MINLLIIIRLSILLIIISACSSCGSAYFYGYDIHRAAVEDSDSLNNLIDAGYYLEATDSHGETPLIWAARRGKIKNVEMLLKGGALINYVTIEGETPLGEAALNKKTEVVKMLIKNGADVNIGRTYGAHPLNFAAVSCDVDSAKLLIENGADINHRGNEFSPIMLSIRENCFSVFSLLIDKGANVDIKDSNGQTLQELIKNKSDFQNKLSER